MCFELISSFDLRDICITEFDELYGKFGSCSIPVTKQPTVSTKGVSGNGTELFWRMNNLDGVQECLVPADSWAFHLPDPDEFALRSFIAHPEGDRHAMLGSPSGPLIWHCVQHVSDMALVVKHDFIQQFFSDLELDSLASRAGAIKRRSVELKEMHLLSRYFYNLMQQSVTGPDSCSRDAFDECVGEGLMRLMRLVMSVNERSSKVVNRERILTRALDYIRQNYATDITVRDLVDYSYTTSRNLQIVFKGQFGLSPLQYLRRYRLIRFHKYLGQLGSVTEAAYCSGLRHMGRLPDQYRLLFGEKPGDYIGRLREPAHSSSDQCCCGLCLDFAVRV